VGDLYLTCRAFGFLTLLMVIRKAALTVKVKWREITIASGDMAIILSPGALRRPRAPGR